MPPCPTPETLSQLASDSESGTRFANLEAHVQICATVGKPGTVGR